VDALLLISANLPEAVEDVVLICRDDEFRYRETFASQRIRLEYPKVSTGNDETDVIS
jgi:hypothetical protein